MVQPVLSANNEIITNNEVMLSLKSKQQLPPSIYPLAF